MNSKLPVIAYVCSNVLLITIIFVIVSTFSPSPLIN